MSGRLHIAAIQELRAQAERQAAYERERGSRRGLCAVDVVMALDELVERRRADAAAELLAGEEELPSERQAIGKLIDACALAPTAEACCALSGLRASGWSLETRIDDGQLTVIATRPREERS